MLEIQTTVTEMINTFNGLFSRMDMHKKEISQLGNMLIETHKTKNQKRKNNH